MHVNPPIQHRIKSCQKRVVSPELNNNLFSVTLNNPSQSSLLLHTKIQRR